MKIIVSKTLPHRENSSSAGTSTGRPRTTLRRGSSPLTGGRRPRLRVSPMASARASTPAACFPFTASRGTAMGQRPRRPGLGKVTLLWCRGRLGVRDGPALSRCGRDIGTGATGRRLPLPPLKRSAWTLLWRTHPRGIGVASRRTLEDPVEARRLPLGVAAVVVAVVLTRDSSSGSPLCLDLARRASNAWRSRFFDFSSFFFESFVDFCFLANWRHLSRLTSSSFTGGHEDRTSIDPCESKDKLTKGSREIQNQSHMQEKNLPGRSSPHQASWGSH